MNKSVNAFIFTICTSLLFSCQSPQQIAGSDHKLVVDKWKALSLYADGVLNQYDIALGARLTVDKSSEHQFILKDFALLKKASAEHINLLSPSFEDKIICTPECSLLTEYTSNSEVNATLLKQYFDDYEFQLFKFYGQLSLLDDSLAELETIDKKLLPYYLTWLIEKNNHFDKLIDLSDFLTEMLSTEQYLSYINDPKKQYSMLAAEQPQEITRWQTLDDGQEITELVAPELIAPELSHIQDDFVAMELDNIELDSQAKEQSTWQTAAIAQEVTFWQQEGTGDGVNISISSEVVDWQILQQLDVSIGDKVCSFNGNYFGIVTEVLGTKFSVYVVGQLQVEIDNILSSAPDGAIFKQSGLVRLYPVQAVRDFSQDQIAPCQVELER
ncbi:MAG: hypothetical protein ACSHW0_02060 [Thalassotalea sp.]